MLKIFDSGKLAAIDWNYMLFYKATADTDKRSYCGCLHHPIINMWSE